VARHPSVTADITDEVLDVRCRALLTVWALRRRVVIPREQIVGARLVPRAHAARTLGVKLGGTYLTRRWVIGGLFTIRGAKGARQWWAAPAGDPVLVIDLRDHKWQRIVLRVPNQETLAEQLAPRPAV
jgi:hypothetical protein